MRSTNLKLTPLNRKKTNSYQMFDGIAKSYDRVNRTLSLGIDILWRKKISRLLKDRLDNSLLGLDLATGTGDVAIELASSGKFKKIYGVDLSKEMMQIARTKIHEKDLDEKIQLQEGDAQNLPFDDNTFDVTTMAFGIRNVPDTIQCLEEIYRTLKVGAIAVILEFSLPKNEIIKKGHLFYLRKLLPKIGGYLSNDKLAYEYLNETIEEFPYGDDFVTILNKCKFQNTSFHPLSFGIATLYIAHKG